ncbi:polymorphic toxin type 46 domain-containing protein [Nostoc sp. C110]|uniref:polymorphic toxin type 46 domain-containing protein n=1 Tax=Nostoc sp. C110 TaxID=3349876 RepID=UPI00370D363A
MSYNYDPSQLEALKRQAEQLNQKAEEARRNAEQTLSEAQEKTQNAMQKHQEAKFSDSPEAARQAEIASQEANAAQAQAKEAQQTLKDVRQQTIEAEKKLKSFEQKAKENETKSEGKTEKDSLKNEAEKNDLTGDIKLDKSWQQHWQNHSDPVLRERFETAQNFYKEAGYSNDKALQEMKGINFNREVSIETIKPGEVLKQYQYPEANREGKVGSYFSKDSDKSELGIQGDSLSNQNRVPELYVANKEVQALKSTSFDVENWTKNKELNYGGGTQYFVAEKDKGSLSRWDQSENKSDTYKAIDQYLGVQKQTNTETQTQAKTDTYSESNRG